MTTSHNQKREDEDDLFGRPAFLSKEDEAHFEQLLAALTAELAPQGFLERLKAHDIAKKIWEERALKETQSEIIESTSARSLEALLQDRGTVHRLTMPATESQNYHNAASPAHESARAHVASLGIDSKTIRAKAFVLSSEVLCSIDRLIKYRETSRNRAIDEHRRTQLHKAKQHRAVNDNKPADAPVHSPQQGKPGLDQ